MILVSFFISIFAFAALPDESNAIFAHENKELINIESSGSIGLHHDGRCILTYPNETLISSEEHEWCSNISKDKNDPKLNPFIQFSIKGKQMKVSKYAVRNGCCKYPCCALNENGKIAYESCCVYLYSYSLQASNDNLTWKVIHKVEKDESFNLCQVKTFELAEKTQPFTYFRFVVDHEYPYCPKCMQINQIELYGETISNGYLPSDNNDDDESISIIGRIKKGEQ